MPKETARPTAACLKAFADLVVIRLTEKGPIAWTDTTIKAAVADVIQSAGGGPLSNVGMVTIEEVLAGGRTFTSDDVAAVEAKVKALLGGQMSKENGRLTADLIAEARDIRLAGIADLAVRRMDALTSISNFDAAIELAIGDGAIELAIGDVVSEQYEVLADDIEAGGRALNAEDFAAIKAKVKELLVVAKAATYEFAADNITSKSPEFEVQNFAQEAVIETLGLWPIVDKVAFALRKRAKSGSND
jgi:hypothetical protein